MLHFYSKTKTKAKGWSGTCPREHQQPLRRKVWCWGELSWRCSLLLRNTQSFEKAKPLWRLERVRGKEIEGERVLNSENVNTNTAACEAVRASNVALPIPVRFSFSLDILEKKPESVPIRGQSRSAREKDIRSANWGGREDLLQT